MHNHTLLYTVLLLRCRVYRVAGVPSLPSSAPSSDSLLYIIHYCTLLYIIIHNYTLLYTVLLLWSGVCRVAGVPSLCLVQHPDRAGRGRQAVRADIVLCLQPPLGVPRHL